MNLIEVRDKTCTSKFIKSYSNFKGYELPSVFNKYAEKIENLEVYDDDVWIITFPKSGTTWTQEITWLLLNNADVEGAKVNIQERYCFLEFAGITEMGTHELFDKIYNMKRPRFIKTHLPWELLPKQIRNFEKRPKIIHVSRDVRDACISFYHFTTKLFQFNSTFEEYCDLFIAGLIFCCPYYKHEASYESKRGEANIHFMNYEDMIANITEEIKKLGKFLNVSINEEELKIIVEHTSFNSMRNNKAVQIPEERAKEINFHPPDFFRKGIAGDYKNAFTEEIAKKFDVFMSMNKN